MKRRSFFRLAGISAVSTLVPNLFAQEVKGNVTVKNTLTNPFETEGKWFKAALHVHTTSSDGDVDVATRLNQYRDKGFDVVAITGPAPANHHTVRPFQEGLYHVFGINHPAAHHPDDL